MIYMYKINLCDLSNWKNTCVIMLSFLKRKFHNSTRAISTIIYSSHYTRQVDYKKINEKK